MISRTLVTSIAAATVAAVLSLSAMSAHAADGLVAVKSPHSAADTATRLVTAAEARGLKMFARVDHAAGAASVGQSLRPTEVLVFGNPKGGTPLMVCAQSAGIDLPLKALVWQDSAGQVWLGYNDPAWLAARHGAAGCPAVGPLSDVLAALAATATAP